MKADRWAYESLEVYVWEGQYEIADRVAVLRLGDMVEIGPKAEVLQRPQHAYTRMLMASVPTLRTAARATGSGALKLVFCWGEVPVKSTVASRFFLSTVILTLMTTPWSIS